MQEDFTCILCTQMFREKDPKISRESKWPAKVFLQSTMFCSKSPHLLPLYTTLKLIFAGRRRVGVFLLREEKNCYKITKNVFAKIRPLFFPSTPPLPRFSFRGGEGCPYHKTWCKILISPKKLVCIELPVICLS